MYHIFSFCDKKKQKLEFQNVSLLTTFLPVCCCVFCRIVHISRTLSRKDKLANRTILRLGQDPCYDPIRNLAHFIFLLARVGERLYNIDPD